MLRKCKKKPKISKDRQRNQSQRNQRQNKTKDIDERTKEMVYRKNQRKSVVLVSPSQLRRRLQTKPSLEGRLSPCTSPTPGRTSVDIGNPKVRLRDTEQLSPVALCVATHAFLSHQSNRAETRVRAPAASFSRLSLAQLHSLTPHACVACCVI